MTNDMARKDFLNGALSSLTVLSLSGCFTPMLYEARPYNETALSFLVTEDGSRLVVLGEKYHYIFDDISPSLKGILLSPLNLRTVVDATLANFYVNSSNVVTGDYWLSLSAEATDEQRNSAIAANFVPPHLTLQGHLKGVRYGAEGFPISAAQTQMFAHQYKAIIQAERSKTAKILLTPVTVAADGVLILGGTALLLLILAGYGAAH